MEKLNQRKRIIKYLQNFGSITTKDAFMDLGVACLPKRISELRKEGYNFTVTYEKGSDRYGEPSHWNRYTLAE